MKINRHTILYSIIIIFIIFISSILFLNISKPKEAAKGNIIQIKNVKFNVLIADTPEKKIMGLGGRDYLKENQGMLFLFDTPSRYGFWMRNMKFPIDILWIRNNTIIDIKENVLPEPDKNISDLTIYYPKEEADKVLEINAGLSKKYDFQIGNRVEINFKY